MRKKQLSLNLNKGSWGGRREGSGRRRKHCSLKLIRNYAKKKKLTLKIGEIDPWEMDPGGSYLFRQSLHLIIID